MRWTPAALAGLAAMLVAGPLAPATAGAEANSDESRVPPYTLPDPLAAGPGAPRIRSAQEWTARRRPELLETFAREVYGRPAPPPAPGRAHWTVLSQDPEALGGRALRREVMLSLEEAGTTNLAPVLHFVVFSPRSARSPVPVVVGLHLFDTSRPYPEPAAARRIRGVTNAPASPGQPGRDTTDLILSRGYALASLDVAPLSPDSRTNWWRGLLRVQGRDHDGPPGPEETGALGLWAWGLSRALDYFATTPDLDPKRVVAIGHSRMGKAALWAGATDERFAGVISNDSGCGGAALNKRIYGETVAIITRAFPHWFCGNFLRYAGNEAALPVDQHELVALLAPRPVYVASAEEDAWADPLGEYLAAWHASAVYQLWDIPGLGSLSTNLPATDRPVGDAVRYHVRRGQHDLTDWDWRQYLDWADRHIAARTARATPP